VALNGSSVFTLSPITGPSTFCSFASESYTVTAGGTNPETTFTWSVPAGATILSGQGTNTILVSFGNTNGNVSVNLTNSCQLLSSSLPVSATSCTMFAGGSNDAGSSTFCNFATETYSIVVGGATPTTTYTWSVPPGATIASGQGTTTILVTFASTGGNISVDVSNECQTQSVSLPVSSTVCSVFLANPIVGPATFCNFASEAYSINVSGLTPTTTYTWSVPAGATITSGQGTNTILVTFATTAGSISVDISNECQTLTRSLPVSPTS
ncbi:unnamed protein product, partial [Phaeothamnion confervicola]